jgi:hypothetical protein
MQNMTVACLSTSACRLTSNNLPPPSAIECDSRTGKRRCWSRERHTKNASSTISNAARHRDSLARCSGVSGVGRRGLPFPPPSTLQAGGTHGQCRRSLFPMCPSAADLPSSSSPSGTAGSHWHDRSRWKGRCSRTGWACRRGRYRRNTRGSRIRRCNGADRHYRYRGAQRIDGERRRTRTDRPDRADGAQRRPRRDGIRRTSRTRGCKGDYRHQWNHGVHRTRGCNGICGTNRAAGPRRT